MKTILSGNFSIQPIIYDTKTTHLAIRCTGYRRLTIIIIIASLLLHSIALCTNSRWLEEDVYESLCWSVTWKLFVCVFIDSQGEEILLHGMPSWQYANYWHDPWAGSTQECREEVWIFPKAWAKSCDNIQMIEQTILGIDNSSPLFKFRLDISTTAHYHLNSKSMDWWGIMVQNAKKEHEPT